MPYKDPAKRKERCKIYYQDNQESLKAKRAEWREKNKEQTNKKNAERYEHITEHATAMILSRVINEPKIWHLYCNRKRQSATKYPFPDDFPDEMIFDIMKDGCVYCGDLSSTIDRLDSRLDHTPENCVGCCEPCNNSKGNGDPNSFIRKAFYRARKKYFDDITYIWSDNETKPNINISKSISQKQQRPFTLTQDEWDALIIADCAYCHRYRPDNKWNGVDRVIPADGYTPGNTVSCCHDCNIDKWTYSAEDTKKRNEKIANRLENGDIILSGSQSLLRNLGTRPNAKKVCAHGKIYINKTKASQTLKNNGWYVYSSLTRGKHAEEIFYISDEFYKFAKESNLENITMKMYVLFNRM